jgi:hypothetical protein
MAASGISFVEAFQGMFIDIVRFPFRERTGTGKLRFTIYNKKQQLCGLFMSLWFKVPLEW